MLRKNLILGHNFTQKVIRNANIIKKYCRRLINVQKVIKNKANCNYI